MPSARGEFQGHIYENILETIRATPVVPLLRLMANVTLKTELLAKLEFFNSMGSVKDRIGMAMLEALERNNKIGPDTVIVEPTSDSTGIALAFACAMKGYRLILTIPESMSIERRKMPSLLGAEIELTPAHQGKRGAIARAGAIVTELHNAMIPQQSSNAANPEVHRRTTAEEIWHDAGGILEAMITGVGTGGTVTGCAGVIKERNPDSRMIAVEPKDSAVLSCGPPEAHQIERIGIGFIPENLVTSLIDEVISSANETAFRVARLMARVEGIPVGISSDAAVAAALEISKRPNMADKRILIVIPSFAERYLSTPLFEGI